MRLVFGTMYLQIPTIQSYCQFFQSNQTCLIFCLEEDIQRAEEMLYAEEINLLPQPPPLPQDGPQPNLQCATAMVEDVPDNKDVIDGGCYMEKFPEEYLASATWGCCKALFESLDEEQKREGGSG